MHKLVRAAATGASATALLALAGVPAEAAATAYNTRTVTLAANPKEGMPNACVTREIHLAAGDCTWSQVPGGARVPHRDIRLAAGWYMWNDCMIPYGGYYNRHSWLSEQGSATAALADTGRLCLAGSHTFGSELAPRF
ncbi:hypothetical protein [Streptomyces erythrochromogenes]|uniref:hypothetical protein n=1 Tax=Streptomyces erythrochromogenes TaxID=285574 RepID=UPI00367F6D39